MSVETPNGSIIYFTEKAVKDIIYEDASRTRTRSSSAYNSKQQTSSYSRGPRYEPIEERRNESPYNIRGYRGFFDSGYMVSTYDSDLSTIEFNTTHGYQFNPFIFLGAGLGFQFYTSFEEVEIGLPIFTSFRANFSKGKVVPFGEIKLGYTYMLTQDAEPLGLYLAPGVGVKFMLGSSFALNLNLGYTLQFADIYSDRGRFVDTENIGGVNFRVGFEF